MTSHRAQPGLQTSRGYDLGKLGKIVGPMSTCGSLSPDPSPGHHALSSPSPPAPNPSQHSSILAWRIPWTEEPGKLQSIESQRVRHDLATNTVRDRLALQGGTGDFP